MINTMPVLRHRLLAAGSRADDFLLVWISVPDLHVHPSSQRYKHVRELGERPAVVLFESVGEAENFHAELEFDADGRVVDYLQLATPIRPAR